MSRETSEQGTLSVNAGPDRIPVEVRDQHLRLVHAGVSHEEISLPPGTYVVTAIFPGRQDIVTMAEVEGGASVTASLEPPGPETTALRPRMAASPASKRARVAPKEAEAHHRVTRGRPGRLERLGADFGMEGVWAPPGEAEEPAEAAEGPEESAADRVREAEPETEHTWWVRFVTLHGLQQAAGADDVSVDGVEQHGSSTLIRVKVGSPTPHFAVVGAAGEVPLNVALPAAGWARSTSCVLTADASSGRLYLGAYPDIEEVRIASQFLASGDVREGARVFLDSDAEELLQGKMADPLGAAVGGYLLLRAGALNRMHDWPENLASWFPWLPDGAIVAGEKAARDGDHVRALTHFVKVEETGLPIFTDGYSFLLSRLRQYTSPETAARLGNEVEHAERILDRLMGWASFVDLSAPTLTFRASSVADPLGTQAPDQEAESHAELLLVQQGQSLVFQQPMPA